MRPNTAPPSAQPTRKAAWMIEALAVHIRGVGLDTIGMQQQGSDEGRGHQRVEVHVQPVEEPAQPRGEARFLLVRRQVAEALDSLGAVMGGQSDGISGKVQDTVLRAMAGFSHHEPGALQSNGRAPPFRPRQGKRCQGRATTTSTTTSRLWTPRQRPSWRAVSVRRPSFAEGAGGRSPACSLRGRGGAVRCFDHRRGRGYLPACSETWEQHFVLGGHREAAKLPSATSRILIAWSRAVFLDEQDCVQNFQVARLLKRKFLWLRWSIVLFGAALLATSRLACMYR